MKMYLEVFEKSTKQNRRERQFISFFGACVILFLLFLLAKCMNSPQVKELAIKENDIELEFDFSTEGGSSAAGSSVSNDSPIETSSSTSATTSSSSAMQDAGEAIEEVEEKVVSKVIPKEENPVKKVDPKVEQTKEEKTETKENTPVKETNPTKEASEQSSEKKSDENVSEKSGAKGVAVESSIKGGIGDGNSYEIGNGISLNYKTYSTGFVSYVLSFQGSKLLSIQAMSTNKTLPEKDVEAIKELLRNYDFAPRLKNGGKISSVNSYKITVNVSITR